MIKTAVFTKDDFESLERRKLYNTLTGRDLQTDFYTNNMTDIDVEFELRRIELNYK